MSANGHTACPKCHPEDLNKVGVWHNFDASGSGDVRENYETYWQCKQVDPTGDHEKMGLFLVHDYRADCWTCGWSFTHVFETLIPGLT